MTAFRILFFKSIILIFYLFSGQVFSQGDVVITGRCIKNYKPLTGATITLYRGVQKDREIKTGKSGKFSFTPALGHQYKMTFSYPGCAEMFATFDFRVPPEKMGIYPEVDMSDIPFFDTTNTMVNLEKYKDAFMKLVFDGDKGFKEDEEYRTEFDKEVFVDLAAVAKAEEEKKAKEEARLKEEAILADKKAHEEADAKARELARLKAEAAKNKLDEKTNETMETEAIRLQRQKEAKALLEKKNRSIKSKYENDLLKMVAENERIAREQEFKKMKSESEANSVISRMKMDAEIKGKADYLREQEKAKEKRILVNQQVKSRQLKKLVEAAAFADRSIKIYNQKNLPDAKDYKMKEIPNCAVVISEGFWTTVVTTTVTMGKKIDIYRKEIYLWDSEYYYKNNIEIDQATYKKEISKYAAYK